MAFGYGRLSRQDRFSSRGEMNRFVSESKPRLRGGMTKLERTGRRMRARYLYVKSGRKRHDICGRFLRFSLQYALSLDLFEATVSVWFEAVCGGFCGQKRSPSPCRCLSPTGTGSVFHTYDCLRCTSESRIKQVTPALSTAQELGGLNKENGLSLRHRKY